MEKIEAYYMIEMKKQKQKAWIRVFGHEYACAYIGLHTQASCMRRHTLSLCTYAESMRTQTRPKNPNHQKKKKINK